MTFTHSLARASGGSGSDASSSREGVGLKFSICGKFDGQLIVRHNNSLTIVTMPEPEPAHPNSADG